MTRIVVSAGTGANPFPWPKGTTNVTCDGNGNIVQLWGRNVDDGTIWKVAHEFNYEQQLTRILLNNGDTVLNTYDGFGYRLKEVTTSGGTPTEKRLIPIVGNRVIQERDSSDAVTARYYWEDGVFFKKDRGTSTKYFVPETRNSPFTGWNNTGSFNRYDWWDIFGVKSDESASGSLSPFQLSSFIFVDASHLTASPFNTFAYAALGRAVTGFFRLTHLNGLAGGGGGGTGVGGVRCIGNRLAEPKASCRAKACTSGVCCSECFGSIQECGDYTQANCPYGEDVFGVPVAFGKCCRGGPCDGDGAGGFGGGGFGGGFPGGGGFPEDGDIEGGGGGAPPCPECLRDRWPTREGGIGGLWGATANCLGTLNQYGPESQFAEKCMHNYRGAGWTETYDKICHCIAACEVAKACGGSTTGIAGFLNEVSGDVRHKMCLARFKVRCAIPITRPDCCPDLKKCCEHTTPYDREDMAANKAGIECSRCPDCVKCCKDRYPKR
jgi:hypothetical protein